MTREEIIELAEQLHCGSIPSSNGIFQPPLNIEKFFWAAYKLGQEEMRKRAAEYFLNKADYPWGGLLLDVIEEQIRNLPIGGEVK